MSDKVSKGTTKRQVSDIDERRRIEEGLRQSERDLAETQRVARLGSWKWDLVSDEIKWSVELFTILGYDPESGEASNTAFLDRVHPEDRAFVQDRAAPMTNRCASSASRRTSVIGSRRRSVTFARRRLDGLGCGTGI